MLLTISNNLINRRRMWIHYSHFVNLIIILINHSPVCCYRFINRIYANVGLFYTPWDRLSSRDTNPHPIAVLLGQSGTCQSTFGPCSLCFWRAWAVGCQGAGFVVVDSLFFHFCYYIHNNSCSHTLILWSTKWMQSNNVSFVRRAPMAGLVFLSFTVCSLPSSNIFGQPIM